MWEKDQGTSVLQCVSFCGTVCLLYPGKLTGRVKLVDMIRDVFLEFALCSFTKMSTPFVRLGPPHDEYCETGEFVMVRA